MKYETTIDLSNKNSSQTLIFDQICKNGPSRPLRILDVGCSSGYLGAAMAKEGHEVWGVEPSIEAANAARQVLYRVFTGFLDDFLDLNAGVKFDAIIFGDVLEHLGDPEAALRKCAAYLSDGGVVVVSIPNVTHFSIRAMMLEGRWEYSDLGILDRTHMRFFTRSSIVELFSESQYNINEIKSVKLPVMVAAELGGFSLSQQSVDAVVRYSRDATGYDFQYVLSARPTNNVEDARKNNLRLVPPGLRVLCLVDLAQGGLAEARLAKSLEHWGRVFGGEVTIKTFSSIKDRDLIYADIVVFQSLPTKKARWFAKQFKSNGTAVVFEIDGLPTYVPKLLSQQNVSLDSIRKNHAKTISIADGISVSTPTLAQHMRKLSQNVFVVPNYAEPVPQTGLHFPAALCDVKLLVSSGDDVFVDFLIESIRRIQQETGVQVIAIGPPAKRLAKAGVIVDQKPVMNHDRYKSYLSSLDNCIGLAPLESSVFSSCKAATEFFDYSASGMPVIASNVPPFSDVIENGVDGFLVENTTAQWLGAMRNLITSHQLREQVVKAAQKTVQARHNADLAAQAWQELFRSIGITHAQIMKNSTVVFKLPGVLGVPHRYLARLRAFGRHMLRPTSYQKALALILSKGPRGFFVFLKRL